MKIKFLHDVSGFIAGEADVHPDVAERHLREGSAVLPEGAKEEKAPEIPAVLTSENDGSGKPSENENTNPEGAKIAEGETTKTENV